MRSSRLTSPNQALTITAIMYPNQNNFSMQGILQRSRWNASPLSSSPPRMVHRLLSSRWSSTEAADSSSPRLPTRRAGWETEDDNDASSKCPAKIPASTTKHMPTQNVLICFQQSSIRSPRLSSPNQALTITIIIRPTPNNFSTQGILESSSCWNSLSSSLSPPRMVHRLLSSRWSSTEAADSSSPRLPTRRAGWETEDDNDASSKYPAKMPASTTKYLRGHRPLVPSRFTRT